MNRLSNWLQDHPVLEAVVSMLTIAAAFAVIGWFFLWVVGGMV